MFSFWNPRVGGGGGHLYRKHAQSWTCEESRGYTYVKTWPKGLFFTDVLFNINIHHIWASLFWRTAKCFSKKNWMPSTNPAVMSENSTLSQTLSVGGKGGESSGSLKWFSSCRFPRLTPDSILLSLLLIQEKQKAGRKTEAGKLGREKKKQHTHTVESGRGERGLRFHWVDWRGFGPLNRSTCSSGISWRQSSILVE